MVKLIGDLELDQIGDTHKVMGSNATVVHTATGISALSNPPDFDECPLHYVLYKHEDLSGSIMIFNAESGKTDGMPIQHWPLKAGGFEVANKEYDKLLTYDNVILK